MSHAQRWPLGAFGMLALVLMGESIVLRHRADLWTGAAWDWRTGGRVASRQGRSDVLCFGDSTVKLGVAPNVLAAVRGRPSYNLALIGGQPGASVELLRRALRSGAKPDIVLIGFTPPILSKSPETNLRQWPELFGLADLARLSLRSHDPDLFGSLAASWASPSWRARHDVRVAVSAALRGETPKTKSEGQQILRNIRTNRGAQILPDYGFDPKVPPIWYGVGFSKPWECDPANAAGVEEFLALAESAGIPVAWLVTPIEPEAKRLFEIGGQRGRFERYLRDLQSRHPSLVVVDGLDADYPRPRFVDPIHFNRQGTAAYSDDIARLIERLAKRDASASRWVSLPKYRERTVAGAIEDLNESLLAVQLREGARR